MRKLTAAIVGLGVGFAFHSLGAEEAEAAGRPAPAAPAQFAEKPRGVCHVSQPGLSLVVEDTTEEACQERRVECQQDHPGREAECRSEWTRSEEKVKTAKRTKKSEASGGAPGRR